MRVKNNLTAVGVGSFVYLATNLKLLPDIEFIVTLLL